MKKRILSMLLCLVLVLPLLPTTALAVEPQQITVTLETTDPHVTGLKYRTDEGATDTLSVYTQPFTMTEGTCAVVWVETEDGYVADWGGGLHTNLYRITQAQKDLLLTVTTTAVPEESYEKNGTFHDLPASVDANSGLLVNSTNFPDVNFLLAIEKLPGAEDGVLTAEEIESMTALDVSNKGIESLDGIEYFYELTTLNCSDNHLAALDLSKNTALTSVTAGTQTVYAYCLWSGDSCQLPLTQFSELDLGKVSQAVPADNRATYDTATGVLTTPSNSALYSSQYTLLNYAYAVASAATPAVQLSVSVKAGGTKAPLEHITEGTPSWYAEGEAYQFICGGVFSTPSEEIADFVREVAAVYCPDNPSTPTLDDTYLRKAILTTETTLVFHVDDQVQIDEAALPALTALYEGENTAHISNEMFAPTLDKASWNPALRLLTYQLSFTTSAYELLLDNQRTDDNKLIEELIKNDFAGFRYQLTLNVNAQTYQNGNPLILVCSCGGLQKDSLIVPTPQGVERTERFYSLVITNECKVNKSFSSYTPSATLTLPDTQNAEQVVYQFALLDSNAANAAPRATVSHTGSGTFDLPKIYFDSELHDPKTVYVRQLEGNDSRYLYDTAAWTLTLKPELAHPIADGYTVSYTRNSVSGDAAAFTNTYRPSGGDSLKTVTVKNPDGSTTTTVTNTTTGTVTETTKRLDGSSTTVVTLKDGSSTTTDKAANGVTTVTKTDKDGNTTATVTVPDSGRDPVKVDVPADLGKADGKVSAVVTYPDGKKETVTGFYSGGKVSLTISGSAAIEILDDLVPLAALPFTDVPANAWYYNELLYAYNFGLFAGTSATTFGPRAPMTRQQMWMVLARMSGKTPASMDEARTWAMENGISDGSNPRNLVTRQQFVTLLWRFAGSPKATKDMSGYTDFASVADYAREAMRWAAESGIVSGTSTTTLSPHGTAIRAQVAVILARYKQK